MRLIGAGEDDEDQIEKATVSAWLERKAAAGGFAVEADSLRIVPEGQDHFNRGRQHGTHASVEFRGTLAVTYNEFFGTNGDAATQRALSQARNLTGNLKYDRLLKDRDETRLQEFHSRRLSLARRQAGQEVVAEALRDARVR